MVKGIVTSVLNFDSLSVYNILRGICHDFKDVVLDRWIRYGFIRKA